MSGRLLVAIAFLPVSNHIYGRSRCPRGQLQDARRSHLVSPVRHQLGMSSNAENWAAGLRCPEMHNQVWLCE